MTKVGNICRFGMGSEADVAAFLTTYQVPADNLLGILLRLKHASAGVGAV